MSHYWLRRLFGSARPEVGVIVPHPFLYLAHRLEAIWRDRERVQLMNQLLERSQ